MTSLDDHKANSTEHTHNHHKMFSIRRSKSVKRNDDGEISVEDEVNQKQQNVLATLVARHRHSMLIEVQCNISTN